MPIAEIVGHLAGLGPFSGTCPGRKLTVTPIRSWCKGCEPNPHPLGDGRGALLEAKSVEEPSKSNRAERGTAILPRALAVNQACRKHYSGSIHRPYQETDSGPNQAQEERDPEAPTPIGTQAVPGLRRKAACLDDTIVQQSVHVELPALLLDNGSETRAATASWSRGVRRREGGCPCFARWNLSSVYVTESYFKSSSLVQQESWRGYGADSRGVHESSAALRAIGLVGIKKLDFLLFIY